MEKRGEIKQATKYVRNDLISDSDAHEIGICYDDIKVKELVDNETKKEMAELQGCITYCKKQMQALTIEIIKLRACLLKRKIVLCSGKRFFL